MCPVAHATDHHSLVELKLHAESLATDMSECVRYLYPPASPVVLPVGPFVAIVAPGAQGLIY